MYFSQRLWQMDLKHSRAKTQDQWVQQYSAHIFLWADYDWPATEKSFETMNPFLTPVMADSYHRRETSDLTSFSKQAKISVIIHPKKSHNITASNYPTWQKVSIRANKHNTPTLMIPIHFLSSILGSDSIVVSPYGGVLDVPCWSFSLPPGSISPSLIRSGLSSLIFSCWFSCSNP